MNVVLPLSGTLRRVMHRRLEAVEPPADLVGAAVHRAAAMVEAATRAQEAALVAHQTARAARLRFAKEFRFAALTNDGGLSDEKARWRLCDRAKVDADEAGLLAEAASAAAQVAQQAADEAREVARVAGLSLATDNWPADSCDAEAGAFLARHREGEAA